MTKLQTQNTVDPLTHPSGASQVFKWRNNSMILNPEKRKALVLHVEKPNIESLSKPQGRRQRERYQRKGLMSKTIAVHVRYKSLCMSLRSSAKQQR